MTTAIGAAILVAAGLATRYVRPKIEARLEAWIAEKEADAYLRGLRIGLDMSVVVEDTDAELLARDPERLH